jgi:hypothetical protein
MAKHTYEIRVVGALGPAGREAFADVDIDIQPTSTVLTAEVGQTGLHALLDRVRSLGLELVDVRQTYFRRRPQADRPPGSSPESGEPPGAAEGKEAASRSRPR